ncbi:MAG: 3-oxoadipyl-CoA thiolase [Pseudomonadota bacterium]
MTDAFICDYQRTPIGRYGGALAPMRPDDMAAHVIRAVLARQPQLDHAAIDEVYFGCANQAGEDNRNVARMATLLAGLPETVPALTLNRLCASGMDAVIAGARAVRCGEADLVIAGGVESMSRAPLVMPKADAAFSRKAEVYDTTIGWRFVNKTLAAQYGTASMPETAENVADVYNITREVQDAFAAASQQKAQDAIASGRLADEIAVVSLPQRKGASIIVDRDEHPRTTTLEKLAKLPTPFRDNGTVTAGNASGVNDGAAALIIASERAVKTHGLTPLARIVGSASAGVSPDLMGIGPVPSTQKLCARLGLSPLDFDLIELNEAFAAQCLAVLRALDIPEDHPGLNANGGGIALGHPLGMSGARIVGSAAQRLLETNATSALCTMCVGVGQGVSLVLDGQV